MKLILDSRKSRRFAWTDRVNGFLELDSGISGFASSGYTRYGKTFFHDVFFADSVDLWRSNALRTEIEPFGARFIFREGENAASLSLSLLVDEGAIALTLDAVRGGCGFLLPAKSSPGIIPAAGREGVSDCFRRWRAEPFAQGMVYSAHLAVPDTAVSDCPECLAPLSGVAVAASSSFSLSETEPAQVILLGGDLPVTWYIAFEDTPEAAAEKAARLVRENGLARHRSKIEAALSAVSVKTGDPRFDEALQWARFSGWMLVTDDGGNRGIWAGLPWFRDNWGRDTFIALSGILLAGGHFAEARSVLSGFARHQNRDGGSPDWGRIPNRWRGPSDVIFNTADGTLWFIRALWEYLQYTGDGSLAEELSDAVDLALRADLERRTDSRGFLLHGDADTWMDARIRGDKPWSPRGDRANDVQALWYTALRIGARLARLKKNEALAAERDRQADRVRESFRAHFWCPERNALADRLPPGPHGEWARDFSVRPNQLFAITVPSVLPPEDALLDPAMARAVLENVERELASPFGLFSLCPDDPRFHPRHEDAERYHKDAAYHNGTIWVWNSGPYVTAAARSGFGTLPPRPAAVLLNEGRMLLESGCAGTLSENIHALQDSGGNPALSGTWSQAWSVSEYTRNVHEDILGYRPRLMEGAIELAPCFPSDLDRISADLPLGPEPASRLSLEIFHQSGGSYSVSALLDPACGLPSLSILGTVPQAILLPGIPLTLTVPGKPAGPSAERSAERGAVPDAERSAERGVEGGAGGEKVPKTKPSLISAVWITEPFPRRNLENEWCGALHRKDWLETLILSGRSSVAGGGPYTAELEWYFDSDHFKRICETRGRFGALWSAASTRFLLWAPTARSVTLVLWAAGSGGEPLRAVPMVRGTGEGADGAGHTDEGTWSAVVPGDLHGVYYTYRVRVHGVVRESADPEARSSGVNGKRSMVVDFSRTDPPGWAGVNAPSLESPNDAVVYELHVADLTSSPTWAGPEALRRKYGGVTARGVTCGAKEAGGPRYPAGFDHLRSLGVTHVQFLPVFDYGSVDEGLHDDSDYERRLVGGKFNWGYDPENYSVPEGVYSTDPFDGVVRIRELKAMIRDFLAAGIGVIMDVVYNHVPAAQNHSLGICVPGYYFRAERYSNAGDDTASERGMFRSYMIDSLSLWLSEYKLSGFRFDLMGLHDVATMNAVSDALRKIKADVLLYGEGWDMYRGGKTVGASMVEAKKLNGIGFFNDAFRCAVKGDAFVPAEGGFLHDGSRRESVKFGLVGAVYHPQVHNRLVTGTANPNPWTERTASSVSYTEIHDNSTLYDKLALVEPGRDDAYYALLQRSAIGLVLLAQGMPILHAGMEFLRTKEIAPDLLAEHPHLGDLYRDIEGKRAFTHNSYNLSDRINGLDWERRAAHEDTVAFTRTLIALRKTHPHFRLRTEGETASFLAFLEGKSDSMPGQPDLLAWTIADPSGKDEWAQACAVVNPGAAERSFSLPPAKRSGSWRLALSSAVSSAETPRETAILPALSAVRIAAKTLYLYAEF